jgi:hypothetical protein
VTSKRSSGLPMHSTSRASRPWDWEAARRAAAAAAAVSEFDVPSPFFAFLPASFATPRAAALVLPPKLPLDLPTAARAAQQPVRGQR